TDAQWLFFAANDAATLALRLLWADAAGDGGQDIVLADLGGGRQIVARADQSDELADVDVDRAALLAMWLGTLQTAHRLCGRSQDGQPLVDFAKIAAALLRWLLRHVLPGNSHAIPGR